MSRRINSVTILWPFCCIFLSKPLRIVHKRWDWMACLPHPCHPCPDHGHGFKACVFTIVLVGAYFKVCFTETIPIHSFVMFFICFPILIAILASKSSVNPCKSAFISHTHILLWRTRHWCKARWKHLGLLGGLCGWRRLLVENAWNCTILFDAFFKNPTYIKQITDLSWFIQISLGHGDRWRSICQEDVDLQRQSSIT